VRGLPVRRRRTGVAWNLIGAVALALLAAGCESDRVSERLPESGGPPPPAASRRDVRPLKHATVEAGKSYSARVLTSRGTLTVELMPEAAPYTVSNFIHLAREGFYDGLSFHSVIPGFVAQAGDPTGTGRGGPGYTFRDEVGGGEHRRGSVGMANTGQPNTGGSQFFICLNDLPILDRRYTVFGRVSEGMDMVDQLVEGDRILGVQIEARARERP